MGAVNKKGRGKFTYRTEVRWTEARKGMLSAPGKLLIEVATPPEFKGHPGKWTPEDLLVASVNVCMMTTFLYYAEKDGLEFSSYKSSAEGTLEKTEKGLIFSLIEILPRISVTSEKDIKRVGSLLEVSEANCLIAQSLKSKVVVTPQIEKSE